MTYVTDHDAVCHLVLGLVGVLVLYATGGIPAGGVPYPTIHVVYGSATYGNVW